MIVNDGNKKSSKHKYTLILMNKKQNKILEKIKQLIFGIHIPIYYGDWQMLKLKLGWMKIFYIKKKKKNSKACVGMRLVFYKPNTLVLQIAAFELDIDDVHNGPTAGSSFVLKSD